MDTENTKNEQSNNALTETEVHDDSELYQERFSFAINSESHADSANSAEAALPASDSYTNDDAQDSAFQETFFFDPTGANEGDEIAETTDEPLDDPNSDEECDDELNEPIVIPTQLDGAVAYEEKAEETGYRPDKPRLIDTFFDLAELIIFTLAAVLIATTFFFRHSVVDGDSMQNTLFDKEHLIISDFMYTPERGDIVVCEDYTTALKKPIVKRIIGLPGETVEIDMNGIVKIDGVILDEPYVYETYETSIYTPVKVTVPDGEVFVMGDHRDNSTDSRDKRVGTIDIDAILGKVLIRFYPYKDGKFGKIE